MDTDIDIDQLALQKTTTMQPTSRSGHRKHTGPFLKGPISWRWLTEAGRLPGKTLHLAVVLHFLAGVTGSTSGLKIPSNRMKEMGVSRFALYYALQRLEQAELITVNRQRGRKAVIELLRCQSGHE